MNPAACPLCVGAGGVPLWDDARCRVIRVEGAEGEAFPGFCRVVWRAHVAEMSDLATADRAHLVTVIDAVERVVRQTVRPDKINLAALGNMVPHLHWHVIPRWADDSHFPAPIWAVAARPARPRPVPADDILRAALAAILGPAVAD